ncbi:MAG: hypothetical protein IPI17_02040 [Nitrosomonas sp.]|nr:hypothetical protein [Nitrosomonas sp.]
MKQILFIISLLLIGLTMGCTSLTSMLQIKDLKDPKELAKYTYRKSLKFEVDGKTYEGIAALPRKSWYDITIIPDEKMTYYIFQTPHRDVPINKPDTGWFNKKYTYKYIPQVGIEDQGFTPLEIAALNKDQEADNFALVEFQDVRPEISLEGNVRCNGEFSKNVGVSICQTAKGLIQEIYFNQKVLIESAQNGCDDPTTENGWLWRVKASEGECPYYFTAREKHKNGERLSHRFTLIGYTKVGVK